VFADSDDRQTGEQQMAVTQTASDLSTLSLDAAVQLDRLARKQPADLESLNRFLRTLGASTGVSHPDSFNLQPKPLDFDILDRAFYRVDQVSISHVADLERRLGELIAMIRKVANGGETSELNTLKTFCLSLHQALLSETSPFRRDDEWIIRREDRSA
jgi:hypothetical protein